MKKKSVAVAALALVLLTTGCASGRKPDKIDDFSKQINTEIAQSARRIEQQLELLNEVQARNGMPANYRVSQHHNLKELDDTDAELMITRGITRNHASHDLYEVGENGVKGIPISQPAPKVEQTPAVNVAQRTQTQGQRVAVSGKHDLERRVLLNGSYTITNLVRQLATGADYRFVLLGKDKHLTVNVGSFDGTVKDAIVGVGNGLGERGMIRVDSRRRIITLEYK